MRNPSERKKMRSSARNRSLGRSGWPRGACLETAPTGEVLRPSPFRKVFGTPWGRPAPQNDRFLQNKNAKTFTTAAARSKSHAARRRSLPTGLEARAAAGNTPMPRGTTASSKRPRPLGPGRPPIRPRAASPCWAEPRWRTASRPMRRRASRRRSTSCSSLLPASAARRRQAAHPSRPNRSSSRHRSTASLRPAPAVPRGRSCSSFRPPASDARRRPPAQPS